MSGFWKYLFQKDEYSVLILGLDNAGKTVIERYLHIIIILIFIKLILFHKTWYLYFDKVRKSLTVTMMHDYFY